MGISRLKMVITVAEPGWVSEAAGSTVSSPNATARIKGLETELDRALESIPDMFVRQKKSLDTVLELPAGLKGELFDPGLISA